jgi:hypothetical protein
MTENQFAHHLRHSAKQAGSNLAPGFVHAALAVAPTFLPKPKNRYWHPFRSLMIAAACICTISFSALLFFHHQTQVAIALERDIFAQSLSLEAWPDTIITDLASLYQFDQNSIFVD